MLPDHAKVIALIHGAEEIIGRKKLQKIVYISKKANLPLSEKYTFRMYGPYSEELTLRVEELCDLGLVSEIKEEKAGYYQYRYRVTDQGEDFLAKFPQEWPYNEAEGILHYLNTCTSKFLELVSTMLYFDHLSPEEVEEKVSTLKKSQNYTSDDMAKAWACIEQIKNHQVPHDYLV
ncbi:YwgA family protein [Sinobaca sp. H24]|uniref:YwgA family protein n=1 Tax=Sinobaca sp. H24 TaxID=2923376 RepID=UPI00207A59F4|nr:YwgA family protein [Sinobaca sp. H24]